METDETGRDDARPNCRAVPRGPSAGPKNDVQGFDEQVLNGPPETLARSTYIDIETHTGGDVRAQILMLDVM